MNNDSKLTENSELPKQETSCCGSGCNCHDKGSSGKTRLIIGVVVLAVAGALVARAMVKNNATVAAPASASFTALPAAAQSLSNGVAAVTDTTVVKEISALSELNIVAKDMDGVFVFLPGKTNAAVKEATAQIRSAAQIIERKMKGKVGVFTLKTDSRDYAQVALQIAVPGTIAMVKGRGMAPVSGEITEAKLVQAFVSASSAGGGCGPSSGGCGPSGCK
jgi:flagellar basal body-associated protein FliL